MEIVPILLVVVAVSILIVVTAVIVGRASAAAEHEYQLSALNRDVRSAHERARVRNISATDMTHPVDDPDNTA